ncbi:SDR family NAD(P)-dependent oxidoreductase [Anaeromyxobacter oryzae]|uniref:Short-chain dehydrogenase n=1 Tax=Anaeromyxobacter oryzae TaxID=2918170 RepID=A0ABN6N0B3_9BACT|nr:SDR family NAD(P)-dependent oxidoreductase [Anaeromyxobacter oryzae]BDG05418.1 short-chain dehydrogenase [Anaeromyxobacter oryzae]
MRFTDRNVLVAGGTGALGQAISLAFLAEGARVTVAGRRASEADGLARAAGNARDHLVFVSADVADPAQAAHAVAEAARGGSLDAVVNAVGAWAGGSPVYEEAPETLARMIAANLAPGHALLRAALPPMIRQGGGVIVEVASLAAVGAQPGQASYAASKAAVVALFLAAADEARGRGVRVNVVLPGTMDTPANRVAMPDADRRGWARTEDVAAAILFLCSDAARAVTGAAIPIRGAG